MQKAFLYVVSEVRASGLLGEKKEKTYVSERFERRNNMFFSERALSLVEQFFRTAKFG